MTLTIELTAEEKIRLHTLAQAKGVDEATALHALIADLPMAAPDEEGQAVANLMREWIAEDTTDDPAELEEREEQWQEFKAGMNANRVSEGRPPVYP
jgi:hypothetical protein